MTDFHLAFLENSSVRLQGNADDVAHHVRCLPSLPAFETRAEEALDKAINALSDTLVAAKAARAELKRKRHRKLEQVA